MKKLLIISLSVFFINSCKNKAQEVVKKNDKEEQTKTNKKSIVNKESLAYFNNVNNLGIGLLKPKTNTITIFNDKLLKLGNKVSINEPTGIVPLFFKPDYGIFYLVCIDNNEKFFEVQSLNKTFYVNKDEFEFINWKNFLMSSEGIDNLNWDKNSLRTSPEEKAKVIKWQEKDDIIVIDLNGNWIKIQNENKKQGWIKWKENNKLLIEIYLLM